MDEQDIVEEVNQRLLITVTEADTKLLPELQSISSNDQESQSANFSLWSRLSKIILAITTIGFFTALLTLIICITPTPPTVDVHSMHISFADHNLWSARFSIKNPNKKIHVTYDNTSMWVYYRRRLVWTVEVGSFDQKGGEEDEVIVKGHRVKTGVIDEKAASDLEKVAMTEGVVGHIDMVFQGRLWFSPGADLWGKQNMMAVCKNVRAKLTFNDEKIYGRNISVLSFDDRRECRVHLPMFP